MENTYTQYRTGFFRSTWTIYKRQLLRLFATKSQIVSLALMPLMWLLIIGQSFNNLLGSTPGGTFPGGIDYITFMTPGILIMVTMFTSMFGVIALYFDRDSGYLKNYLIAPIPNLSIVFGYVLGIYTRVLTQVVIIMGVGWLSGASIDYTPLNVLDMFLYPIATTIFLSGLAITIASKAENVEVFQSLVMPISMPLMFLSPIMFPLQSLPDYFQWIAKVNPLTYGVQGLRASIFGNSFVGIAAIDLPIFNEHIAIFNLLLLIIVGLIFLILGSKLFLKSLEK